MISSLFFGGGLLNSDSDYAFVWALGFLSLFESNHALQLVLINSNLTRLLTKMPVCNIQGF
jgi:hypothetical protein